MAVKQALTHRPDLEALRYAIQANKSLAKVEMAGYYPQINLSSDISQQTNQTSLGSNTSVTVNQLVYSFAGPQQRYQLAKNVTAISELDKVSQSNLIRVETEKAFLQTWLVQEQQQTIDAQKKSAKTTFEKQKHKNKLDQLDKDAWLASNEDYAASTLETDQYEDNLQIAYKRLEFFMGQSLSLLSEDDENVSTTELTWQYKKKYSLKPLATYQHYALTSRPEIPQGLKRMAIQDWNVKLARGQRLPVITANAEAGCTVTPANTLTVTPTPVPEVVIPNSWNEPQVDGFWSIGVSFRWNLFDGLVTQYQEQSAQASKTREMLDREQTILRVKQEVAENYFGLTKALKQLKAQNANYLRSQNNFKLMEQKLALGKISQSDFDKAQTIWQQAKLDWLARNITVAQAECELKYACGYHEDLC